MPARCFLNAIEPPRSPHFGGLGRGLLPTIGAVGPSARGARGAFNQSEEFKYEAAIRGDRFDVFEWWALGASLKRHDVVEVGPQ